MVHYAACAPSRFCRHFSSHERRSLCSISPPRTSALPFGCERITGLMRCQSGGPCSSYWGVCGAPCWSQWYTGTNPLGQKPSIILTSYPFRIPKVARFSNQSPASSKPCLRKRRFRLSRYLVICLCTHHSRAKRLLNRRWSTQLLPSSWERCNLLVRSVL